MSDNNDSLHNLELSEIMDVHAIQDFMNDYYFLTGIGIGIIDMKGHVLVSTGWQEVCTKFHRAVPASCQFCLESDTSLSQSVAPGTFKEYRCKNNMWDISTPIMVGDIHIGNIFLGQFLYEDEVLDLDFFRSQARRFGYDEDAYISALLRVPRYSREKIQVAMSFYSKLAIMISKSNYENVVLKNSNDERRKSEEQLKELLKRFELAASLAHLAVWEWNVRDNHLIWDDRMFEMYGVTRDKFPPRFETWVSAIHPDDRKSAVDFIHAALKGEKEFDTTFRISCPDGKVKYIKANAMVINGSDGKPERMIGINKDITALRLAENELRDSEEKLRSIMDNASTIIYIKDLNCKFLSVNPAFEKRFHFTNAMIAGKTSYDLFSGDVDLADRLTKIDQQVIQSGKINESEEVVYDKDGMHTFLSSKFPLRKSSGEIYAICGMSTEITERKRAELELIAAKEAAEKAALAKSRFLDIAAHELRTPVTSFSLIVQLAQKQLFKGHPVEASTLERLHLQAVRISSLVVDLLDVSRLERGGMNLKLKSENIVSLLNECLNDFKLRAPKRNVIFLNPQGPIEIKLDSVRINQVISNLLDNAAKYTPGDSPLEVSIEKRPEFVRISVKDYGPGISDEQKTVLFTPFTRGSTELTNRSGGLGLGLYICRRIIELHGGTIGLESKLGIGSTFYFELPITDHH